MFHELIYVFKEEVLKNVHLEFLGILSYEDLQVIFNVNCCQKRILMK
jgi:hypothetical protein